MNKILVSLIGLYLFALAIYWVWLIPSFVDKRISSQITIGMSGVQVASSLGVQEPFDIKVSAHCAPMSMDNFSRISIYHAGGVPLLPLPMFYVTTTTLCFDSQDKLVVFQTERGFDST